jgi:CHASE3 domain sensor protein
MRNKKIVFLLLVLMLMPVLSLAQTRPTNEATREKMEMRQETAEQKRDEVRTNVAERRNEFAGNLSLRAGQYVNNVIKRLRAAANRLDTLAARIESRIVKMEENGTDVSKAKNLLDTAKIKIEEAKSDISNITFTPSQTDTTSPAAMIRADFESARESIQKAKTTLKEAHALLVDVIVSLRASVDSNN